MRTAEKYRRFGQECAELARTAKSPANKAILLRMARSGFASRKNTQHVPLKQ
jgi:hypothetical protein